MVVEEAVMAVAAGATRTGEVAAMVGTEEGTRAVGGAGFRRSHHLHTLDVGCCVHETACRLVFSIYNSKLQSTVTFSGSAGDGQRVFLEAAIRLMSTTSTLSGLKTASDGSLPYLGRSVATGRANIFSVLNL